MHTVNVIYIAGIQINIICVKCNFSFSMIYRHRYCFVRVSIKYVSFCIIRWISPKTSRANCKINEMNDIKSSKIVFLSKQIATCWKGLKKISRTTLLILRFSLTPNSNNDLLKFIHNDECNDQSKRWIGTLFDKGAQKLLTTAKAK